jgi:probable phosphoglycerate mutase
VKAKPSPPRPARLFAEPEQPTDAYTAYVDGAARGNPGPAAYAVIVVRPDGRHAFELGKRIGRATNNVAEYHALLAALDYAASHGITRLRVRSDSELMVRQMQGRYKVKSADLRRYFERARKQAGALAYFSIEYIPRERNRDADRLANAALDETDIAPGFSPAHATPQAPAALKGGATDKRIRAHYSHGALHPQEPLDLAEGEEVELILRKL